MCEAAAQFREHHIISDLRQGKKSLPGSAPGPGWAGSPTLRRSCRGGGGRWEERAAPGCRGGVSLHTQAMQDVLLCTCECSLIPTCNSWLPPWPLPFDSAPAVLGTFRSYRGVSNQFVKIGLPWCILVLGIQAQSPGLSLTEHLLCARHCAMHYSRVNSFNPCSDPMSQVS